MTAGVTANDDAGVPGIPLKCGLLLLAQRPLYVPLGIAAFRRFPLVVQFLPFGQTEQQFRVPVLDINLQRNQGVSLLLGGAQQLVDFLAVKEQFPGSRRVRRIEPVAVRKRLTCMLCTNASPSRIVANASEMFTLPARIDLISVPVSTRPASIVSSI